MLRCNIEAVPEAAAAAHIKLYNFRERARSLLRFALKACPRLNRFLIQTWFVWFHLTIDAGVVGWLENLLVGSFISSPSTSVQD